MINRYVTGEFDKTVPNFKDFTLDLVVDGAKVSLGIWDYAPEDDSGWEERLRSLSYFNADVHVLCFSLVSEASLEKGIEQTWLQRVRQHNPAAPVMLVGTKLDLRSDETMPREAQWKRAPVSYKRGTAFARKIGAVGYRECSALTGEGVKDVFETAVRAALQYKSRTARGAAHEHQHRTARKRCVVM